MKKMGRTLQLMCPMCDRKNPKVEGRGYCKECQNNYQRMKNPFYAAQKKVYAQSERGKISHQKGIDNYKKNHVAINISCHKDDLKILDDYCTKLNIKRPRALQLMIQDLLETIKK